MKSFARLFLRGLAGLFLLLLLASGLVYALSEQRLRKEYPLHAELAAPDPSLVDEGRYLVATRGCTDCHGADLGGRVVVDQMPVARLAGANLTRLRTEPTGRSVHEGIYMALRHGLDRNSRPLLMMPPVFASLSAREVEAIAAYVNTLPEMPRDLPESELGPLGRALLVAGKLHEDFLPAEHIDHAASIPAEPPAVGTLEYGRHVAALCAGCHRPDFAGGPFPIPGAPPASNLTPSASGLRDWTQAQFIATLRTGIRPNGHRLDSKAMPWKVVGQSTDAELESIWRYLRTVPPVDRDVRDAE